ncbi:MAG: multidrug ABC transporter ATP-binding protein [Flavobacteriaceae bacterium]|nr:multidrug ABC transporter ATP-binding protein [Flavobacteriaceae bacterium]|tara:strand:+ start:338 stop:1216 length:879 start_codon:yes stop_codon:yes gene_type:complete
MRKLILKNLSKTYSNNVKALDNVSIEISSGMFGLLGPNGAGKSSLMRTIATLQEPDSGTIFLDDLNILNDTKEFRQHLGYLPQEFGVYPRITAEQLLDHIATLKGISSKTERKDLVDFLLQKVNLYDKRNKNVKGFSGGMKQRIGIAQSLIGDPKVLIVDEPTAGLDPGERNRFYDLISDVGEDVIVILSTHIVDDVRELCTQMAIMNFGQIVFSGVPDDGIKSLKGRVFEKQINKSELDSYKKSHNVISNKLIAGKPVIHILNDKSPDKSFKKIEPSLEDVFFTNIQKNNK